MKKYILFLLVILLLSGLMLSGCATQDAQTPEEPEEVVEGEEMTYPEVFHGSTSALTSSVTLVFAGVEPEFKEILGSDVRMINVDLIMSQAIAVKERRAQFWNTHLGSAIRAIYGMEEFASEEWGGPQRLRIIWRGGPTILSMIARADSGMTTVADLKGKKVAVYPGGEGFISACLAHAGLTLDDVEKVPTSAYNDALRAVLEGRADSAFGDPPSSVVQEIAATPGGLVFLSIPHDNKEGWAALQSINPSLLPIVTPEGFAGAQEAWGVEMLGFPNSLYAYDYVEDAIPYGIAKVLHQGYESYKERHASLEYWTLDTALDVFVLPVPMHSGAIRYFKDQGLWTDEMQEWQDRQLDLEDKRIEAWYTALNDAAAQGIEVAIDNPEWQALWKGYLSEIE